MIDSSVIQRRLFTHTCHTYSFCRMNELGTQMAAEESPVSRYCCRICQEGLRKISFSIGGVQAEILTQNLSNTGSE